MKSTTIIISVLFFLPQFIISQTINIHTTDGNTHQFNIAEIDSITFAVDNWELIFEDDFENIANGQYPEQNGWKNYYSGVDAYVSEEKASSGQKSFKLIGQPYWARVDFTDISYHKKIKYQAMIYIPTPTNSYPRLGLWNSNQPSQWGYYPIIRFEREIYKIYCFGAPSGEALYTEIGEWEPNKWYLVEAIVDFETNQLTVKLDGSLLKTVTITSPDDYNGFQLGVGGHDEPGQSVVYFDDVKIYKID